jgi:hypothetical protein
MTAKPTEEEIRAVVALTESIMEASQSKESRCEARKVKDLLLWVLGDESSKFATCVDKMNACDEDEDEDELSHSE